MTKAHNDKHVYTKYGEITSQLVDGTRQTLVLYCFPPILLSLIQTEWLSLVVVMTSHSLATELHVSVDISPLLHEVD